MCKYETDKMPPPPTDLKTWSRQAGDDQYLCTTDPTPIDLEALDAALSSDLIWWAKPVEEGELKKMVDHSLCLSLYHVSNDGDKKDGSTLLTLSVLFTLLPLQFTPDHFVL